MAPFSWFGGKGRLAQDVAMYIPRSRVYVEPYGGAASVLLHLSPRPIEVLNDLNNEIITLFRVLQDRDCFAELAHRLTWTPYSLAEFDRALAMRHDNSLSEVDRAFAFFVAQNQGFSGKAKTRGDWGRSFTSARNMACVCAKWRGRLHNLAFWHDRLTRVQLDNRDAIEVIAYWDSPDTAFYIDPPYVADARVNRSVFAHEADDEHHVRLVDTLLTISGMAVVSGYASDIYRPLDEAGWTRREIDTACHAAGRGRGSPIRGDGNALARVGRTEVLWIRNWSIGPDGQRRHAAPTLWDTPHDSHNQELSR
jgi:DNA adenine methylase